MCVQRRCSDRDALACAAERGDARRAAHQDHDEPGGRRPQMGATPVVGAAGASAECASFLLAKMAFSVDLLRATRRVATRRCSRRPCGAEATAWRGSSRAPTWRRCRARFGERQPRLTPLVCASCGRRRSWAWFELAVRRVRAVGAAADAALLVAAVRGAAEACARLAAGRRPVLRRRERRHGIGDGGADRGQRPPSRSSSRCRPCRRTGGTPRRRPTSASSRSLAGAGGAASTSRTRATATPSSPAAGRRSRRPATPTRRTRSIRPSCRGRGPSPSGTARPSRRSRWE